MQMQLGFECAGEHERVHERVHLGPHAVGAQVPARLNSLAGARPVDGCRAERRRLQLTAKELHTLLD